MGHKRRSPRRKSLRLQALARRWRAERSFDSLATTPLGDQLAYHGAVDVRQATVDAIVAEGEAFVVDSE